MSLVIVPSNPLIPQSITSVIMTHCLQQLICDSHLRPEITMEKIDTLSHYLHTQNTHEAARNTITDNNRNNEWEANCKNLSDEDAV